MEQSRPTSESELRDALVAAARAGGPIALGGNGSKQRMSARAFDPATAITTACMRRVLQYEPRDLTVSVQAGLPWTEFSALLAENRQMVPFDPPHSDRASVGGVVAANSIGPRRRGYGGVRDFVIGMTFATLDGKLAKSGGMVVKNVAGFDMAKLMIGSFGTLAAMAVVNFKVAPIPEGTRTFVLQFGTAVECAAARDGLIRGVLQPAAMDALNPAAAKRIGLDGFVLLLQAGGNEAMLNRYPRELPEARVIDGDAEQELWRAVREFTPDFVAEHAEAHVARVPARLTETADLLSAAVPVYVRAGTGTAYLHFGDGSSAPKQRYVFEYGAPGWNGVFESDFAMMESVKRLFDPKGILNPGRLYGRI
jgi:glycolate oxidase FAD binding subunit